MNIPLYKLSDAVSPTFFVYIHETQVPGCLPACIVPGPQMRPEALDFVAEAFKWVQIGDGMGACAVGRGAHVQGEATLTMCSLGRLKEAESSGDQDSLITITDLLKQKWRRDSGAFLAPLSSKPLHCQPGKAA